MDEDEVLKRALEPVLRDLLGAGFPVPVIGPGDWDGEQTATATLWSREDGSGTGVQVDVTESEDDRVARVADQLQEWAIEQTLLSWPVCPDHRREHPLVASTSGGVAVWVCPSDGAVISVVGSLRSQ